MLVKAHGWKAATCDAPSNPNNAVLDWVNMNHNGNLLLGILAGLGGAIVGALIWMGITVATGLHVGYVAIGVGALVGFAVRWAGRGATPVFGFAGAILTIVGCLAGESLAVIQLVANDQHQTFFSILPNIDSSKLITNVITGGTPMTYLIYAIGVWEGYKLSIFKQAAPPVPQATP